MTLQGSGSLIDAREHIALGLRHSLRRGIEERISLRLVVGLRHILAEISYLEVLLAVDAEAKEILKKLLTLGRQIYLRCENVVDLCGKGVLPHFFGIKMGLSLIHI